ncbi:MAG: integrase family protein [Alphaproteobacteria bacterium]|nr:integrase family protein [Alphaproteobacteria bacterium]
MPKLTKVYCEGAKPPAAGYEIHWDDRVPGYGLRVTATGVRAFVAQGRVRGKAIIVTIGRFGLYTEDQARRKAQAILQDMREGIDPRDVKKQDEAMSVTLREVATAYINRPGMLKARTKIEMERHIEKVFAKWKDRPIASLTPGECRKRFEDYAANGLHGKRGAPVQATIAFTTLRTLWNWARDEYRKTDGASIMTGENPVINLKKDMKKKAGKPRDRRVELEHVGTLWNWLQDERGKVHERFARAAIDLAMFMLLTGGREGESSSLEWRNVHLDDADPTKCSWHIEDPKNDNPVTLPLSRQAADVLRLRRTEDDGDFVFASWGKTGHITDARAPLRRFAKHIGMAGLSDHDLRRTFIHVGAEGCDLDVAKLELLTNHMPQGVTQKHYLKTGDLRGYHRVVARIGDFVELEAAKASGANVVKLESRA